MCQSDLMAGRARHRQESANPLLIAAGIIAFGGKIEKDQQQAHQATARASAASVSR